MPRGSQPGERRGGRQKGTPNKVGVNVREAAQQYTQEAIAALAEIVRNPGEPAAARVSAIRELLDRGHGKATQLIEASGPDGGPIETVTRVELVAPGYDDGED